MKSLIVGSLILCSISLVAMQNVRHNPNEMLLTAAHLGMHTTVRDLLLLPGIDVNIIDVNSGFTPLMAAASAGHLQVVQLLLALPTVNLIAQDQNGNDALALARLSHHLHIAQLLIAAGAQ